MMRITLEALSVLDAIDRRGSFAAAAAELHRVPSAVTYQVQKLEEDLDVRIFDRRGHRARLTPAGRELLDAGRTLLERAGELERRVRRVATGWEPELRIAVDAIVPWSLVWPLAAAFYADCARQQSAYTRLHLRREVLGGTWDALATQRADLAIGASGDVPGPGYRTRPLAEVSLVFAVSPQHPLASVPEPIATRAILLHRVVVAGDSSRRLPARTVGLLEGQDVLTVPDLETKIAAQVAGLGCGFVPVNLARAELASGRLVARRVEEPLPPARLVLGWRAERAGRALAWWIEALQRSGLSEQLAAGARGPAKATSAPSRRGARRRRGRSS